MPESPQSQPLRLTPAAAQVRPAVLAALRPVQPQIDWVCEALIPADPRGELPSAHAAGVPRQGLPLALQARDDLLPVFVGALSALPPQAPVEPLRALQASLPPAAFEVVVRLIAGAYFLDPAITAQLGYPGQQSLSLEPDYEEVVAAAERVMALGPMYVPAA